MQQFKEFEEISKKYFSTNGSIKLRKEKQGRPHKLARYSITDLLDKDANIVDAGCGSNMFRDIFPNLIGFDIVDFGNQDHVCNILEAPIQENSQDGILCLGVLHECPDEYHMPNIEKMVSWLKLGGKLIMRCKEVPVVEKHLLSGRNGIMSEYLDKGLWNTERIQAVGSQLNLTLEWKEKVIKSRAEQWRGDSPFSKERDNDIIFEGYVWCWRKNV
jgi:hypothetical protein